MAANWFTGAGINKGLSNEQDRFGDILQPPLCGNPLCSSSSFGLPCCCPSSQHESVFFPNSELASTNTIQQQQQTEPCLEDLLRDGTRSFNQACNFPLPRERKATTPPAGDTSSCAEKIQATLIEKIKGLTAMPVGQQEDLIAKVCFFFSTQQRVENFVSLYFDTWHVNSPILHRSSFDLQGASTNLLLAVSVFGASYSEDITVRKHAAELLDLAEVVIFDAPVFHSVNTGADAILWAMSSRSPDGTDKEMDWASFQDFQAGYLIATLQYWSGSRIAKRRIVEGRFGDLVGVSRRSGLLKLCHEQQESSSEWHWLQREMRIRTIFMIKLLDVAFLFYNNFPCRFTSGELQFELPCEPSVFDAEHPFAHEKFTLSRGLTGLDALHLLSREDYWRTRETMRGASISPTAGQPFSLMDLYLLAHVLCAIIHTYATTLPIPSHHIEDGVGNSIPPARPTLSATRATEFPAYLDAALSNWRICWNKLFHTVLSTQQKKIGLFRNGDSIWMVAKLLKENKEAANVQGSMDVLCEDKLAQLKVLIRDNVG